MVITLDEEAMHRNENGDHNHVMVWNEEPGEKTIKSEIRIKKEKASPRSVDISEFDPGSSEWVNFKLTDYPDLQLKSFNYFPVPNEGEFTLTFSGSKKPVTVRILDMMGNLKFEDHQGNFNGYYNRVMNLKSYNKGTYLLQVFQQGKVVNRKVMIN